jgi:hypothetical protein
VIVSYPDDATRDIHVGEESRAARRYAVAVRKAARRKLDLVGAAVEIRAWPSLLATGWSSFTATWRGSTASG